MNFLYPELSPQPRFLKILEFNILPELEKYGFKLLKSGPSLKKIENGFEWIVEFDGRKFNIENTICRFNPYFLVRNSKYRKFLTNNPNYVRGWGTSGQIGNTSSIRHWDKQLFSMDNSEAYFLEEVDFAKYDNLRLVEDIVNNVLEVGIPYFKMMSDLESIKNFYVRTQQLDHAPMLIDMSYILNREQELKSIFDWYFSSNDGCADWLDEQMELRKKNWLQH